MPTPSQAFAVVASTLAGIDPEDREAVSQFYETKFVKYPSKTRELISDFLIGQTHVPSDDALLALKQAISAQNKAAVSSVFKRTLLSEQLKTASKTKGYPQKVRFAHPKGKQASALRKKVETALRRSRRKGGQVVLVQHNRSRTSDETD
jgi:hypothetical protein